jgi:hypothetical protein
LHRRRIRLILAVVGEQVVDETMSGLLWGPDNSLF